MNTEGALGNSNCKSEASSYQYLKGNTKGLKQPYCKMLANLSLSSVFFPDVLLNKLIPLLEHKTGADRSRQTHVQLAVTFPDLKVCETLPLSPPLASTLSTAARRMHLH